MNKASSRNAVARRRWQTLATTVDKCLRQIRRIAVVFALMPALVLHPAVAAEKTLYSFASSEGTLPLTGLVQGSDGAFYGTTQHGGLSDDGNIFKITSGGVLTTLHSFSGADGQAPSGTLIQATDGNFYGTTSLGGTAGYGTVFKITPTGAFNSLYSFQDDAVGISPAAGLVQAADGNFYGTTSSGGGDSTSAGAIFRITPGGAATSLHVFTGVDGAAPGGLAIGSDGALYGTASQGGMKSSPPVAYAGVGSVFKITTAGVFTEIYAFSGTDTDGASPLATLLLGADGSFYGTTLSGGTSNAGTVFKVTQAGTLTTLFSFTGPNGANPAAALVQAADGSFYGTTSAGGASYGSAANSSGFGTLFKLDAAGQLTTLHSFSAGADSAHPEGALVFGTDGGLYSTAYGSQDYGNVFRTDVSGSFSVLHTFSQPDGVAPASALLFDGSGNFYGTTGNGGYVKGTIFKITLDGLLTGLHEFDGTDGTNPYDSLIRGSDGNFYGTTYIGGSNGDGTVFVTTPAGDTTVLHSFAGDDGVNPYAPLLEAADGALYGSTSAGGANSYGTLFKITKAGVLTTLHDFNGTDGEQPMGGLVQVASGTLYGTTYNGGANSSSNGTIFSITPTGVFTSLHTFSAAEGANSQAALTLGPDGSFYGTTVSNGTVGTSVSNGTVFKMTADGSISILHSFSMSEGGNPMAPLLLASDGNFYGTTSSGGNQIPINAIFSTGAGGVFRITPDGTFTTLYLFGVGDGSDSIAGLTQGPDGNFYGTTQSGGRANEGVIFEVDGPPLIPTQLTATPGNGQVTLNWNASGGASTYNVYVITSGTAPSSTPTATGVTTTNANVNGLNNGTSYQFFVAAVNANGTSSQSNEATAMPSASSSSNGGGGGGAIDPLGLLGLGVGVFMRRRQRQQVCA